jgi:hypothetical protein
VRKYIDLIVDQPSAAKAEPSAEEKAVDLSLTQVDSRIRRWEETLERGLLSLEDSAHRIKELRQEREALLRRKVELQKKSRSAVRFYRSELNSWLSMSGTCRYAYAKRRSAIKKNSYERF